MEHATLDEFLAAPAGKYAAGPTWLVFCVGDQLSGLVIWGRPDGTDARNVVRCMPPQADAPLARRMARYFDLRGMEAFDPIPFTTFIEHVVASRASFEASVTRVAVVHTGGFAGVVAAGLHAFSPVSYPMQLFQQPLDALAWSGVAAEPVLREVESALAHARGTASLLLELHAALQTCLQEPDAEDIASRLGLSQRTLQRRLNKEGTTFQRELAKARVDVARRRLRETDDPLAEIAFDLGFASPQHFGDVFRQHVGVSPKRWREEHRPRGG